MTVSSGKSRDVPGKHQVICGNNEIIAIYEASKFPLSVYFEFYSRETQLFNIIACHVSSEGSVYVLFSVHRGYAAL